jgi:Putative zinc-finger
MPPLHIEEDDLEQYSLGTLAEEQLAALEEHLLICPACQSRLKASDEFVNLFRAAAVQPDARPRRLWQRIARRPLVAWPAAVAVAASVLLIVVHRNEPVAVPTTVFLQSLRGPDSATQVRAGKPAFLVFDLSPAARREAHEARVVDPLGAEILKASVSTQEDRAAVFVDKLRKGSYWIRLYRRDGELIAEYGLEAR